MTIEAHADLRKKTWLSWLPGVLLLMPYLDRGPIKRLFTYNRGNVYVYATVFMMIAVSILLWVITRKSPDTKPMYRIKVQALLFGGALALPGVVLAASGGFIPVFVSQLMWILVPICFAWFILKATVDFKIDLGKVLDNYVILFAAYCVFSIATYVVGYGFRLGQNVRVSGGSGSGGLLFGYTIVLVMGLLVARKRETSIVQKIVISSILVVFTLLNGSRIATALVFVEVILLVLPAHMSIRKPAIVGLLIATTILIMNPVDLITKIAPRMLNLNDSLRSQTLNSSLELADQQGVVGTVFGSGLGGFFPYQAWLESENALFGSRSFDNTVEIQGQEFLVQPHNSYIHLYFESGIVGVLLLLLLVGSLIIMVVRSQNKHLKFASLFILFSALLLNNFDSAFTMHPGTAGIWWTILFLLTQLNVSSNEHKLVTVE